MALYENAREVLEELNAMAMESDCGLVDTPQAREEAQSRIAARKTAAREKMERDAAKERSGYSIGPNFNPF